MVAMLAATLFAAAPPNGKFGQKQAQELDTDTWIDANKILMFVTNKGSFAYDQGGFLGKNDGLYYPFSTLQDISDDINTTSVIFASGIWVGAVDSASGDTLVTVAEYSDDYWPGPMVSGTFIAGADVAPQYRVYKLYSDSLASNPNADYLNWPVAQGAPVDSLGSPDMLGDQMCWAVYNDANPASHVNDASSDSGLGLEIKQTTFAFDRTDPLGEIVFIKAQIYNKGGRNLKDMFVSLWADPDLGDAGDDFDGCDTILSLGYCYNATNNDQDYGSTPPAVGYDFFQGPLIFTGDNADTAIMWNFQQFVGYQNLPMTSYNKYINGTDPQSLTWTYQYMNGLDASNGGAPLPNGTKFFGPGDPTTNTGDNDANASDRRYMLTTGPFDFPPGDSTEIVAAIIVGQGGDRLSSISILKYNDKFAQATYDNQFQVCDPPDAPIVKAYELNGTVALEWTDISEINEGCYPFQGYTVSQGLSSNGPWTRVANFDISDGVGIILDDVPDPLTGVLEQRAVKFGSDNEVRHYFGTKSDAIKGGNLINHTAYFFRVEAYSYTTDPLAIPKTQTSATVVKVIPQRAVAGTEYGFEFADTIPVTHVTGLSDGQVLPLVVDPTKLTGDDYEVTFEDDISLGSVWHLVNITTGDTVLADQLNQTGNEDYLIVDGMLLKVTGPAVPGMKDWDIPSGTRRFTWSGADGFGWEGFSGAMGWGGPSDTHGFGTFEPIPPSMHVSVLLVLAKVDTLDGTDTLGSFTFDQSGADSNVSYGYRYGRGFTAAPANPAFIPYIVDDVNGGYRFQDFTRSVPLSAWNVDVSPPQRLAVGFLENNAVDGRVDGKYFPGSYNFYDNVDGNGPREWLWIYLEDYSTTPNAAYQGDATADSMPVLWWVMPNRRGEVPFSEGGTGEDQFLLISNHINTPSDLFTFTATSPAAASGQQYLDDIKAVPNPYYLFSSYDNSKTIRKMKFINLPEKCDITIYNLAGHFITRISKDDITSFAEWDVVNDANIPVASGIYVYVVDAPGFGQKIGKMAIFTEIEILGQY